MRAIQRESAIGPNEKDAGMVQAVQAYIAKYDNSPETMFALLAWFWHELAGDE